MHTKEQVILLANKEVPETEFHKLREDMEARTDSIRCLLTTRWDVLFFYLVRKSYYLSLRSGLGVSCSRGLKTVNTARTRSTDEIVLSVKTVGLRLSSGHFEGRYCPFGSILKGIFSVYLFVLSDLRRM